MGEELNQGSSSTAVDRHPPEKNGYTSIEQLAGGVHAKVFKAACIPANSAAAVIKIVEMQRVSVHSDAIQRELQKIELLSHPNVLKPHCSLSTDGQFCIVMPWMSRGSLQSIVDASFPDGLPEEFVATILREILNALAYLHGEGHVHKDLNLGNILIDPNGIVKLADFGISSSVYSYHRASASYCSSNLMAIDVSGNPYWISPEVIKSPAVYTTKADIWSFGIVAMELASGRCPASEIPESDSLKLKISKRFQFSEHYMKARNGENISLSKDFKEMVGWCLDQDPAKRPSAEELLLHPFFKKSKGPDFLIEALSEQCHRPKLSLVDEATSQSNERRIREWKFNKEIFQLVPVFDLPKEVSNTGSKEEPERIAKGH